MPNKKHIILSPFQKKLDRISSIIRYHELEVQYVLYLYEKHLNQRIWNNTVVLMYTKIV